MMLHYDYSLFFQYHWSLAAYGFLALTLISFYFTKNNFARSLLFVITVIVALLARRIDMVGLAFIILFGALFYYGLHAQNRSLRGLAFAATLSIAIGMMFTKIPGIYNWKVASQLKVSADGLPYSMYFTFDKSLIALFFLWFAPFTVANEGKWKPNLHVGLLIGMLAVLVLIPLSYYLGYVKLDLKTTNFFILWAIHNLLFTCIAEEALFRGMIQAFLMRWWQNWPGGKWAAILITAVLFGAAHFKGGITYILLAAVAGVLYGYAFSRTRQIEASVITHFWVNMVHFLAFTYPALATAIR